MHPILGSFRRLGLYLLAWAPLAALLAWLMAVSASVPWRAAIAMSFPLCFLYAFVCLSAWYPCRTSFRDHQRPIKFLQSITIQMVVVSVFWNICAEVWARALAETDYFPDLVTHLPRIMPLLMGTGVFFYLASVALFYSILSEQSSRELEARAAQAHVFAREAELKALKAQVNPHFLFNSLNSISALTTSDASKAREMCVLLGDFLRRTLGLGEKTAIPLEEELSLIHAFLAVEKIRFGPRIQMEENIDKDALAQLVPPLLLQPLVENAVVHGVAGLVEGGEIRLDAHCRDGNLSITVANDFDPDAPPRRKGGVGLANVRQRLEARYGDRATFAAKAETGRFCVAITFPAESEARPS